LVTSRVLKTELIRPYHTEELICKVVLAKLAKKLKSNTAEPAKT
jgi:hypothetical protein